MVLGGIIGRIGRKLKIPEAVRGWGEGNDGDIELYITEQGNSYSWDKFSYYTRVEMLETVQIHISWHLVCCRERGPMLNSI